MKKVFYTVLFLIGGICGFMQSCTGDNEQLTTGQNKARGSYNRIVNLCPEQRVAHNEVGELNFDEAFAQSSIVIYAISIKKIDSSYVRGVRLFYLYRASAGMMKKPSEKKYYKNNRILFLSHKALFEGKTINDSVYLFLKPLEDYNILRSNIMVQYEWVPNAPFIMHSALP
ncbi:MAG: hypothetical protein LBE82_01925 [Chitinophagaceae bacterium]|jgi:hypothetical protein|nr:hypothetical protein [Chitinophagaceae bacterium]